MSFRELGFEEIRVRSPGPLRLVLPLHMGFLRISSRTDWVSENSIHRKPSFRERFFSEGSPCTRAGACEGLFALRGDAGTKRRLLLRHDRDQGALKRPTRAQTQNMVYVRVK